MELRNYKEQREARKLVKKTQRTMDKKRQNHSLTYIFKNFLAALDS